MTVSVKISGSQTATISTEHTLATVTDAGIYGLAVDLDAMVDGDVVEIALYGKARPSDTERLIEKMVFAHTQGRKMPLMPSLISPHHYKVTLKQTAGTGRTFPWAIYSTGA